jgi:hypothetical protein
MADTQGFCTIVVHEGAKHPDGRILRVQDTRDG